MTMRNQGEYLQSKHWRDFTRRWKKSHLPHACLGCLSNKIELHHVTYVRLGNENLNDVVPLCPTCRGKLKTGEPPGGLTGFRQQLTEILGVTAHEASARIRPFLDYRHAKPTVKPKSRSHQPTRREKMIADMKRDRAFHERMCRR